MNDSPQQLTHLLNRASAGDESAANQVYPIVYQDLRRLASAARRGMKVGETLQATALVNEAYLRIAGKELDGWKARSHFFFSASRAMRDILVENARKKSASKRGGDVEHASTDEVEIGIEPPSNAVLSLNLALERLESTDPDGFKVAMLRYFAGLTVPEVAELMQSSVATVERKWQFLKAWLGREIDSDG